MNSIKEIDIRLEAIRSLLLQLHEEAGVLASELKITATMLKDELHVKKIIDEPFAYAENIIEKIGMHHRSCFHLSHMILISKFALLLRIGMDNTVHVADSSGKGGVSLSSVMTD